MGDRREVHRSLDLALHVGEILLVSGAGAADVTAAMVAVTRACGVPNVAADVTFTDLTLRYQPSLGQPVVIQVRRVSRRGPDYAELIEADQVVRRLVDGDGTLDQSRDAIARILSTGRGRPWWAVTFGWGVMGAGIALTLGGGLVVCLLAFVAAACIDRVQRLLPAQRIPSFFQQAAGGLVATLIALAAGATPLDVDPSRVVTAGIVMLLAGVGITGATQDALTGFPVTATARLLDALLNTAGIIAGVGAGLTVGALLRTELGSFAPGAAGFAASGVTVVGAAVAAAAFAFACYAPLRALVAAAIVAALGQTVMLVAGDVLGHTWGAAAAAVTIGGVCYVMSGRFRVPPLVVVVPAIVPLLPGLAIYRGLALLASGQDGVLQLASAFATALALAAGVTLGQYLARPLKREARRLETRLPSPHLVGPFRHASSAGASGRGAVLRPSTSPPPPVARAEAARTSAVVDSTPLPKVPAKRHQGEAMSRTPSPPSPFTAGDYRARMERVVADATEAGLDGGVLVTPGPDLVWLTGYQPTAITERLTVLVLSPDHEPTLLLPRLERPDAEAAAGATALSIRDWTDGSDPYLAAGELLDPDGRYAVSDSAWSMHLLGLQAMLPRARYQAMTQCLPMLRAVKDDDELERLGLAAAGADSSFLEVVGLPFAGRRETEVAADLAGLLRRFGHEQVDFTVVGSGPNGANPHHEAGDRVIEVGDAVVLDFGGLRNGYGSDTTRTVCVGEPDPELVTVHGIVREAQQAAFEAVRPGVACQEIDRVARAVITEAGYGEHFIHRTGHGIGVTTHEPPYLVEGEEQPLRPGMCFSIEPGIYLSGRFGVRIEDIVTVTADGGRRLNTTDHGLAVVS